MKRYGWLLVLLAVLTLTACGENQLPPEPEEGVLIYAALNPVTNTLEKSVARFNENHEDVQIEIHDYSDEGGRERLQTELVLGRVPDIMELRCYGEAGEDRGSMTRANRLPGSYSGPEDGYFMPYQQLVQKGYLEDLWPYIENDPDLGREAVLEAPLKAAEVNGGLYMLFERTEIYTLIGRESVVGAHYGWTLDDMMDAYAAMPEGSTIMRYNMTKQEVFYNLLCNSLERFVDRATGKCTFDSVEFRSLVGFLETLPDEAGYEEPHAAEDEVMRRIKNGTQMLEGMSISWAHDVCFSDSIFQERAAFVGYPTADGSSGSFFYQTGTVLAMSSTCQNKEAAWEYIRMLVTPLLNRTNVVSRNVSHRVAHTQINLNDYEVICSYQLDYMAKCCRLNSKNPQEAFWSLYHFRYGPKVYLMDIMTEKDIQRHRELIDHTTQLFWPEDELANTVWETLGPYFAGDRTLDDTIALIQNRVGLYLNEQK